MTPGKVAANYISWVPIVFFRLDLKVPYKVPSRQFEWLGSKSEFDQLGLFEKEIPSVTPLYHGVDVWL